MTPQARIDAPSDDLVYSILLNIPINYHPMNLLPAFAPTSNLNIADHLSKPLPTTTHQRIVSLIGAGPQIILWLRPLYRLRSPPQSIRLQLSLRLLLLLPIRINLSIRIWSLWILVLPSPELRTLLWKLLKPPTD